MAKDKLEKKEKRKLKDVGDEDEAQAGDVSMMSVDADVVDGTRLAKKAKKEKEKEKDEVEVNIADLAPIAKPLAQRKLAKRLHRVIKKASKQRQVRRGVKEVVKSIRKGEKGLLIVAADITPMDIISHLPVLSEEADIPYVFVPSKEELGHASSTKRPTSCVMVCPNAKKSKKKEGEEVSKEDDYKETYDECCKEVRKLDTAIVF